MSYRSYRSGPRPTSYIQDTKSRVNTYHKRRAGVVKKAMELASMTAAHCYFLCIGEDGIRYSFLSSGHRLKEGLAHHAAVLAESPMPSIALSQDDYHLFSGTKEHPGEAYQNRAPCTVGPFPPNGPSPPRSLLDAESNYLHQLALYYDSLPHSEPSMHGPSADEAMSDADSSGGAPARRTGGGRGRAAAAAASRKKPPVVVRSPLPSSLAHLKPEREAGSADESLSAASGSAEEEEESGSDEPTTPAARGRPPVVRARARGEVAGGRGRRGAGRGGPLALPPPRVAPASHLIHETAVLGNALGNLGSMMMNTTLVAPPLVVNGTPHGREVRPRAAALSTLDELAATAARSPVASPVANGRGTALLAMAAAADAKPEPSGPPPVTGPNGIDDFCAAYVAQKRPRTSSAAVGGVPVGGALSKLAVPFASSPVAPFVGALDHSFPASRAVVTPANPLAMSPNATYPALPHVSNPGSPNAIQWE